MILLPILRAIKRIIAIVDFILFTMAMYLLSFLPQSLLSFYRPLFRYWCKSFIEALGVQLFIHQKYKTQLPQHYLVISNHPSAFEDIGMSSIFKARFLAKEEMKDWFILGRISMAAGSLYVKRDNKHSRAEALQALTDWLEKGESVGLYPEGGCFDRRLTLPFHTAAFHAAFKTNTAILPVFLQYEAQEDFEWKHQTLIRKIWEMATARNPRVNYHIFEPILPHAYADKDALVDAIEKQYLSWQAQYLE